MHVMNAISQHRTAEEMIRIGRSCECKTSRGTREGTTDLHCFRAVSQTRRSHCYLEVTLCLNHCLGVMLCNGNLLGITRPEVNQGVYTVLSRNGFRGV